MPNTGLSHRNPAFDQQLTPCCLPFSSSPARLHLRPNQAAATEKVHHYKIWKAPAKQYGDDRSGNRGFRSFQSSVSQTLFTTFFGSLDSSNQRAPPDPRLPWFPQRHYHWAPHGCRSLPCSHLIIQWPNPTLAGFSKSKVWTRPIQSPSRSPVVSIAPAGCGPVTALAAPFHLLPIWGRASGYRPAPCVLRPHSAPTLKPHMGAPFFSFSLIGIQEYDSPGPPLLPLKWTRLVVRAPKVQVATSGGRPVSCKYHFWHPTLDVSHRSARSLNTKIRARTAP